MKLAALSCALFVTTALANTEKYIFKAPSRTDPIVPRFDHDDKSWHILNPSNPKFRTSLPVAFPSLENPHGEESYYWISHLRPGQRYEVRICWAAIQPTSFKIREILDTDQFLQQADLNTGANYEQQLKDLIFSSESSVSLIIQAAADFFTTNETLMNRPPAVDVDIILDPYVGNTFPDSLLLTALFITSLAVSGFVISGRIWAYLTQAAEEVEKAHTD